MKKPFFFALAYAVVLGCSPAIEQDASFPSSFTKKLPDSTIQARVEGDRLHGLNVDLRKAGSDYSGSSAMGIVDLHATQGGTRIEGTLGAARTELYVHDVADGMTGKGLIAGELSHFDLKDDELTGKIGICEYDLHRKARSQTYFEGQSRCGTARVARGGGTRVALPAGFDALPLDERAVFIATFLGF